MRCGSVIPAHTKNQKRMKSGVKAKKKVTIQTRLNRLQLQNRISIHLHLHCHLPLSMKFRNQKKDSHHPITLHQAKKRPAPPAVRKWIGIRRKRPGDAPSADTQEVSKFFLQFLT